MCAIEWQVCPLILSFYSGHLSKIIWEWIWKWNDFLLHYCNCPCHHFSSFDFISSYLMNSFSLHWYKPLHCIVKECHYNGTVVCKLRHYILCIYNCVIWWIILTCKLFLFDFIVLESVLYIGEPFIASSKMSLSLQRSVGRVSCVIPTVMCDVVILVMCAMYWVLQFVHWFCHCIVTKSVKNHLFKIIWKYVKYHHKSECLWLQTREW